MHQTREHQFTSLSHDLLQAFDNLSGIHSGFRPTHAKGIMLGGRFRPSDEGRELTSAPHVTAAETSVSVRFSNFGGIPTIPDSDPNAAPRGMAIRFHFAEHVHTDIVAHSVNGFPARTAEEFLGFLQAAYQSGPGVAHPTPIELFLGSHPAALAFVQTPKPVPTSFAREQYFAVNAYKFVNNSGAARFGRYQITPEMEAEHLSDDKAKVQSPDFLFEEIERRLAKGPVRFAIRVQLAEDGDVVDDATVQWPDDRRVVQLGTLELVSVLPDNTTAQRKIIFDPIPRVDGIEASADPLLEPRADLYLLSGRRRRTDGATAEAATQS